MASTTIADIIDHQDIAHLPGNCSIRDAGRYMVEHGVGSVLVIDDNKLRGIFTERDALRIFVATRRNADHTNVEDVMTENPVTLTPDSTRDDALKAMDDGNFRHLPVIDDKGNVLGVVSQRDLIS